MITFPNAKINLGLSVVSKRSDGYHNLETVFYPVGLKDILEMVPADEGGCNLHLEGMQLQGNVNDNLIVKAYHLLNEISPLPSVDAYLYKNIPSQAGLGGGSSDASFALTCLKQLFELSISDDELEKLSARLGADCPFFIQNKPVYAQGIGDQFTAINFSLKGYFLVLVKPPVNVSTKEAFSGIHPHAPQKNVSDIILNTPITAWKHTLKNDFEETVFACHPQLQQIKEMLYQKGAIYASMSGSGSALYGIFEQAVDLANDFPDAFVWGGACEE